MEILVTKRVLFVCLGNICRSPAAEGVARKRLAGTPFDSAGTSGWHEGEAPYPPMQAAALKRGYDLSGLRARAFVAADFDRFDLIIGMDARNLDDIESIRPESNTTDVRSLMGYAPETGADSVPDPYYTRDFDGALDLIETAIEGLARQLQAGADR